MSDFIWKRLLLSNFAVNKQIIQKQIKTNEKYVEIRIIRFKIPWDLSDWLKNSIDYKVTKAVYLFSISMWLTFKTKNRLVVEIQINNSAYSVEKKLKISGADSRRPSLLLAFGIFTLKENREKKNRELRRQREEKTCL